jgi:hypothetical protein
LYVNQWYSDIINLPEAWDLETGANSNVKIGIIDAVINWEHEDIGFGPDNYSNVYRNSAEDDWSNPNDPNSGDSIDNDGNGYIDDFIGWNFPLSSNDTRIGDNQHGTLVAGIASAKGNNNIGTAGIAGGLGSVGVKIVPCNTENPNPLFGGVMPGVVDDAIYYAVDAGCKIINFSLAVNPSADITDAIDYAYSQGVTMIAASGNDNYFVTTFPAGHIKTIAVGGFDQNSQKFATSNYGHTLDISGPAATGWGPFTTSDTYGESGGTSVAAPVIGGIAALMLTQNPCLGPRQIKEILTATATKIGGYNYNYQLERPGKSLELGYRAINAEAAIQEAIYFQDNSYDLYMRDRYNDAGRDEGYTWTWDFDASPDIWVRNQDDYSLFNRNTHIDEQIEYSVNQTKYIYVRVGNKVCQPSVADASLTVYQSPVGTSSEWPEGWDGTNPFPDGSPVGTQFIPILQPGESVVLKFPWNMSFNVNTCILARITGDSDDQIVMDPGGNEGLDVWKNNNIALNNIIVIDHYSGIAPIGNEEFIGTYAYFGNTSSLSEPIDLTFRIPSTVYGNSIIDEAEVTVIFDAVSWSVIENQLVNIAGVNIVDADLRKIHIKDTFVELTNLLLPTNTRCELFIGFNFLTDEVSDKTNYGYHILQNKSNFSAEFGEIWTGGAHLIIKRNERNLFNANAGNANEVRENEIVLMQANDIGENAIYNWYDEHGNLIHTGKSFSVTSEISKKYKLEVIAESDLYKDYDEIELKIKDNYLKTVIPNPVNDHCSINYKLKANTTGVLTIAPVNSQQSVNSYLVNDSGSLAINLNTLTSGFYQVLLITNGVVQDAKTIYKN